MYAICDEIIKHIAVYDCWSSCVKVIPKLLYCHSIYSTSEASTG